MPKLRPYIVLGDVHLKFDLAESLASEFEKSHAIIFVGDYFDSWNDSPELSKECSLWLKKSLRKPNRIHLLGNHDLHYNWYGALSQSPWSFTKVPRLYLCSGYSREKDKAINSILNPEDWSQLKLHHLAHGWHVTHAGMHPYWFPNLNEENRKKELTSALKAASKAYQDGTFHTLLGEARQCRGGSAPAGGIMWHDHRREATPLAGLRQIYGHTIQRNGIDILENKDGVNICVDCDLLQFLELHTDGTFMVQNTYR